jgi:hypothetical protein
MVYDSEDVEEARLSVPGPCIHHWASKSRIAAHLRETDCVAGHVGLELGNVVANYPFEGRCDSWKLPNSQETISPFIE